MYAPDNGAAKYARQKLIELKGEINKFTIIVTDFHTSLSATERTTTQNISRGTEEFNSTICEAQ